MNIWCPTPDSNRENLVSKTSTYAIPSAGRYLVESLGFEPNEPKQQIYSLPPRHTGIPLRGGQSGIRTQSDRLLRSTCLPITPTARKDYRSRYRKMVCAAGFEPATPRVQGENSDRTELRTVVFGRGDVGVFMIGEV